MSLKFEQYRALWSTRQLLRDLLLGPQTRPRTVKELRARASSCLRHFPPLDRDGAPMFSRDPFPTPPLFDPDDREPDTMGGA